ncbi:ATP-dependent protease ATPase subunit HslU [Gossypium arboreum]|uniref:ATP-dependent protease ATPase subunit HslU n=1 Tax=Gossypium arboreum TaxID=29729 RepID=A0A0B0P4M3_GOSAR|nr:ATP-dependent protease ATPase subunit HslU [Gossypium arboreum]
MCIVDNMPRKRLRDLTIIQNPPNSKETNSDQHTAIGSSNVPNTIDEPIEIQTENGWRRKTRGHTLLKDLYDLNSVEHVKVSKNSHGRPIALEAQLLAGYLGIIARNVNLLPINYESWHHMPNSNKNQALNNIKGKIYFRGLG